MIRIIITGILIFIFGLSIINAQYNPITPEQSKYHVIDINELNQTDRNLTDFIETLPPVGNVKSIAEFERMQGVIISFKNGFGIPVSAIAEMSEDIFVYTIVKDQIEEDEVVIYYNNEGVNLSNVIFIQAPLNSFWSRDYSPWFIRCEDEVSIVDFPYNRNRPKDDEIPVVMSQFLNTNLYGMPIEHTGGNYMTDGMGKAASTDLTVEENSNLSVLEIQQIASDYLGIDEYEFLEDPMDEYIKHIDCWAKYLDVDKILIGEVPSTDYRYADYEALADYYANKISSYGTPYSVFRTYSPNGQPYTNSLILNDKVFVPIVDGSGSLWNDTALAVYQQALPGYEIIGIVESGWVNWQSTDALHCRTHGVPDLGMLYVKHIPIYGEQIFESVGYDVHAEIIAYSDSSLIMDSLRVYFKTQSTGYNFTYLLPDTGNVYTATITGLNYSDTVSYFIEAVDNSVRKASHPVVGEIDPHVFTIEENPQGIAVEKQEELFKVFPNPSTGVVYVKSDFDMIQIFSLDGKLLLESKLNNLYERFDIGHLSKGVYVLKGYKDNHSITERLILY